VTKIFKGLVLAAWMVLQIGVPLLGADVSRLDHPATRRIDFDFFPFVIVGVGIAIGIVWSRRRKKLGMPAHEPPAADLSRRK
jgi:hypothetical protein